MFKLLVKAFNLSKKHAAILDMYQEQGQNWRFTFYEKNGKNYGFTYFYQKLLFFEILPFFNKLPVLVPPLYII